MKLIDWIKSLFNKFIGMCKRFIASALPLASQLLIGKLRDVAITIVEKLQATDLTDEEKRAEAFRQISEYVTNAGIDIRDSLINLIIELALQFVKTRDE